MHDFQKSTEPGNEKEKIYDELIYPLMTEILQLCAKHRVAIVSHFHLGGDLYVSSALLEANDPPIMHHVLTILCPDKG